MASVRREPLHEAVVGASSKIAQVLALFEKTELWPARDRRIHGGDKL